MTQLKFLEELVQERAPAEVLRAVMRVIHRPIDQHRHVEEKFLYPAIRRAFGEDFAPLQVMEAEHEQIGCIMHDVIKDSGDAAGLARNFIEVLRQHIQKEIQVLFPMSETRIPPIELEQMACQCVEFLHQASGVCPGRKETIG